MVIVGVDPGTAIVGWSAIKKVKATTIILGYNAIRTIKSYTDEQRLLTIYNDFSILLDTYKPDVVSVEQLFFATNAKTVITVAQARGIILLVSAQRNIPVVSYSPLQIKKTITGDGKAEKKQIQFMLEKLLKIKAPHPDDISDAIAIALTHAYTTQFI